MPEHETLSFQNTLAQQKRAEPHQVVPQGTGRRATKTWQHHMHYKKVAEQIKTMLDLQGRLWYRGPDENMLDQSQIGWGEDNTPGNTSASEAKRAKSKLKIERVVDGKYKMPLSLLVLFTILKPSI